jgi:hypothetical protein
LTGFDHSPKLSTLLGIPMINQIPATTEKAQLVHRDISGDLRHPGFIRIRCPSCDLDLAALRKDEEEQIIGDQPAAYQNFCGENVGPMSTAMCVRMKSVNIVVYRRFGAGRIPWRWRMLPMLTTRAKPGSAAGRPGL